MSKNGKKSRLKLAIILLAAPTLIAFSSFIVFLVVNLVFNPTFWMTPDTDPVTETPLLISVLNGVLITIGGIGVLSFLPGLVIGIYLIARKKNELTTNTIDS